MLNFLKAYNPIISIRGRKENAYRMDEEEGKNLIMYTKIIK